MIVKSEILKSISTETKFFFKAVGLQIATGITNYGIFISVTSFFGFYGAIKEHPRSLSYYLDLSYTLIIGIIAFIYFEGSNSQRLKSEWIEGYLDFIENGAHATPTWNRFHRKVSLMSSLESPLINSNKILAGVLWRQQLHRFLAE